MPKVQILQPWVPAYREPFFQALKSLGASDGIEYEVSAGKPPESMNSDSHLSNAIETYSLNQSRTFSLGSREFVLHKLGNSWLKADLVIAEHAIKNLVTFKWSYLARPKRLALWGHGRTYTKPKTGAEAWLKTNLVNRADWFFAYTQGGVDSVVADGFPLERTTVVQNSTDTSELTCLRSEVTSQEVLDFKKSRDLGDGPIAVFVGAFDPSKRLPFLFEAAKLIQEQIPNFQLLVFGEGPERAYVEAHANGFIKYLGRADLKTQALVSHVASVILMPGRVGLIAVDSFSLGLPIITTNWPWHAPECEYLTSGVNSLTCKDELADYANQTAMLLADTKRLEFMKTACFRDADFYSIEKMSANFHQGVIRALEIPYSSSNRIAWRK
jgi:glycosyltransferase involved in cell wall biosynthesis